MSTKTFYSENRLIEAPVDRNTLTKDSNIIIKVRDNSTGTIVGSKTIPASDIYTSISSLELVADKVSNPYSLNFNKNTNGSVFPESVVYNIYENISTDTENSRNLVGQFTINTELNDNSFNYYVTIGKYDTTRISLDFGGINLNKRYTVEDSIDLTVSSVTSTSRIEKTITISYDNKVDDDKFDISGIVNSIKESIDDNLKIDSNTTTNGAISITNKDITESERYLKYGVITNEGDTLLVINWVDGGILNQVDTEIEPLGSIVLKLYDNALPLDIKDIVIFTELYSNDIIIEADLSESEIGSGLNRLTPNFKKEIEDNTISTFNEYQSFNDLTLSGSDVQNKVIDYFLQKKQKEIGLNTDFTDFNNFIKFSSAEERLVNFHYKVEQLEMYTSQSASLSNSTGNTTFIKDKIETVDDKIRSIKNGFDEYELFLFNDSGSIYESKPFVSSSDNIFASWPKNSTIEKINDGSFNNTSSWDSNGVNGTNITSSTAKIYKNGEISQSISLTQNREYILKFDVYQNGLPVSFEYNGKTIIPEKIFSSGSNTYSFTTTNLSNSDDIIKIIGADYGDINRYTQIDNLSLKEKPSLLSSNSTTVKSWYNNLRNVAKDYDARNKDSLKNNTPEYIKSDDDNSDYILFLDMIGHMFDGIWLYANELNDIYDWDNSISKGLSEDLSIVLLEAYGNNLDVGFSEKDVWEYILGVNSNNDELGREIGFSFEKRQKETIRRLLVNLPYFLKNKGTARSIKGLVLSYGIPLSTMFIREYGTFQGVDGLESIFTKESETKKLRLNNGYIKVDSSVNYLDYTNAIEFNFQLPNYNPSNIDLVSGSDSISGGGFTISAKPISQNSGSILLTIQSGSDTYQLSSSTAPIYNNEFWNVLVQQNTSGSYELKAYQFNRNDGTYNYQLNASGSVTSSISSSIDDSFNTNDSIRFNSFDGYLDEFRIWNTTITDSEFKEHVKFPTSIKLSDPLQIPNSLLARVDINSSNVKYIADNENKLPNLVFNPTYPTQITASGFSVSDFVTYTRTDYINSTNVGNTKLGNNKVRYELTQSLNGGVLTPNFNGSVNDNENIQQVDDSYQLTIGFSPTDITNEIILQHFGGNDLLNEFGDPTEQYNDTYSNLRNTVESFFNNISINRNTKFFIDYIRNFDKTLFDNIKRFVPERSDLSTSIFIEPHYLDRSKAKRLGQSETENLFKDSQEIINTYDVSSTSNTEQNTNNPLVTTDEESLVASVLSEANINEAITVISEDEVLDYLNQSTDVIILQDGFESKVLQNNVWESDSSITVTNKYGEKFRFKVYKFDYKSELANLESLIGNYLQNNDLTYTDNGSVKFSSDTQYSDYVRLWKRYNKLDGKLFLLDYNTNPIDNAILVTYEDLPQWLKEDLILSKGTASSNKTVTKNGITYIISDDTIDGGPVVEFTKLNDTRTIVSDPNGDIKLTVE